MARQDTPAAKREQTRNAEFIALETTASKSLADQTAGLGAFFGRWRRELEPRELTAVAQRLGGILAKHPDGDTRDRAIDTLMRTCSAAAFRVQEFHNLADLSSLCFAISQIARMRKATDQIAGISPRGAVEVFINKAEKCEWRVTPRLMTHLDLLNLAAIRVGYASRELLSRSEAMITLCLGSRDPRLIEGRSLSRCLCSISQFRPVEGEVLEKSALYAERHGVQFSEHDWIDLFCAFALAGRSDLAKHFEARLHKVGADVKPELLPCFYQCSQVLGLGLNRVSADRLAQYEHPSSRSSVENGLASHLRNELARERVSAGGPVWGLFGRVDLAFPSKQVEASLSPNALKEYQALGSPNLAVLVARPGVELVAYGSSNVHRGDDRLRTAALRKQGTLVAVVSDLGFRRLQESSARIMDQLFLLAQRQGAGAGIV